MAYVDPNTVHNPATGTVAPAAWGDTIRDDLEFLIDPPTCSVKGSTNQTIPNNTATIMTAGTETFDNDSMHSTVTNTSRITIQTAGRYLVFATVRFASNATGGRVLAFKVNGTTLYDSAAVMASPNTDSELAAARSFVFTASDYIEVSVLHTVGLSWDALLEDFTAVFITR